RDWIEASSICGIYIPLPRGRDGEGASVQRRRRYGYTNMDQSAVLLALPAAPGVCSCPSRRIGGEGNSCGNRFRRSYVCRRRCMVIPPGLVEIEGRLEQAT